MCRYRQDSTGCFRENRSGREQSRRRRDAPAGCPISPATLGPVTDWTENRFERSGRNPLPASVRSVSMTDERNVLGTELVPCGTDPMTGYRRDGCCHHVTEDAGRHEICAVMTDEFLTFSRSRGNDLITPRPELDFPGLTEGDRWCLCLDRWIEAEAAEVAPPVVLEATAEEALERIERATLEAHACDE